MRYLLLIFGDEAGLAARSEEERAASDTGWDAYTHWLVAQGWMRSGEALRPSTEATTVSRSGEERIVTDGPFAVTKEQLGGYYEIDVPNLDDAIEAAARCPGAATGTIEIRPVMELPTPLGG
ncbi:MAG TPA: YciI family protein [Actinomycetota bacterium]|nr:YciI family protein [Actinomycetota bacterium]